MGNSTENISNILNRFLRKHQNQIIKYKIYNSWQTIAGKAAAKHSAPYDLKSNTLFVAIDNKMWHTELSFAKTQLIANINKENSTPIKDIYFKFRSLPKINKPPSKIKKDKIIYNERPQGSVKLDLPVKDPLLAESLLKLKTTFLSIKFIPGDNTNHHPTEKINKQTGDEADYSFFYPDFKIQSDFTPSYDEFQSFT